MSEELHTKLDNTLPVINFSDLVQMVRMKFVENGEDKLGYAKAAEMIDRAIKPYELEARKDAFDIVERVFTGSDDFRIKPGIDLNLGIGQIKSFRDGMQGLKKNLDDQARIMGAIDDI